VSHSGNPVKASAPVAPHLRWQILDPPILLGLYIVMLEVIGINLTKQLTNSDLHSDDYMRYITSIEEKYAD